MAIEFGSKQAERILHRDKVGESVPPEVWQEIKDLREANVDNEWLIATTTAEIESNMQRICQLCKRHDISIEDLAYFAGVK